MLCLLDHILHLQHVVFPQNRLFPDFRCDRREGGLFRFPISGQLMT